MPSRLLGVLVPLVCGASVTGFGGDHPLRYAFRLGETNVYQIQIELTAEGGVLRYDGPVFLVTRQTEPATGQAVLSLRGNLPARPEAAPVPMPYRPPFATRNLNFPHYAEIEVDATGRILAEVTDIPLPLQAGKLGASLILALPTDPGRPIETTAEVSLPDDTPRPGMPWYPRHYEDPTFGRTALASFRASRTTRVELKEMTAEKARLEWVWNIRSGRRFEGAPQFDGSGEGSGVFDRVKGLLREIRFSYRETSASETVTRRSRLVFDARLLEGDERAAALSRAAPRTAQTLSAADVRAALEALDSRDEQQRAEALAKLQTDSFDPLPVEIASRAEALLDSRDESVRWVAARLVAEAATSEQVPTLIRLLRQPESPARMPAIQALGRLKDPQAIEPLVEFIARGESERYAATEALKQFGPEAEDAVLGLFTEMNLETRRAACQILEQLGTALSLDTLREAMLDTDRQLRDLASQAVGAIAGRGE